MVILKEDIEARTLEGKDANLFQELITAQELINDVINKLGY